MTTLGGTMIDVGLVQSVDLTAEAYPSPAAWGIPRTLLIKPQSAAAFERARVRPVGRG